MKIDQGLPQDWWRALIKLLLSIEYKHSSLFSMWQSLTEYEQIQSEISREESSRTSERVVERSKNTWSESQNQRYVEAMLSIEIWSERSMISIWWVRDTKEWDDKVPWSESNVIYAWREKGTEWDKNKMRFLRVPAGSMYEKTIRTQGVSPRRYDTSW